MKAFRTGDTVKKELVEQVVEEARGSRSNLVIWDERDTFTVEPEDLQDLEVADDYLKIKMQDDRATIYIEFDAIYKLVLNKERSRAGFGLSS